MPVAVDSETDLLRQMRLMRVENGQLREQQEQQEQLRVRRNRSAAAATASGIATARQLSRLQSESAEKDRELERLRRMVGEGGNPSQSPSPLHMAPLSKFSSPPRSSALSGRPSAPEMPRGADDVPYAIAYQCAPVSTGGSVGDFPSRVSEIADLTHAFSLGMGEFGEVGNFPPPPRMERATTSDTMRSFDTVVCDE